MLTDRAYNFRAFRKVQNATARPHRAVECKVGMQLAVDLRITLLLTVALISKVSYGARQVEIPVHPRHAAHLQPTMHLGTSETDMCFFAGAPGPRSSAPNIFVGGICLRHRITCCAAAAGLASKRNIRRRIRAHSHDQE